LYLGRRKLRKIRRPHILHRKRELLGADRFGAVVAYIPLNAQRCKPPLPSPHAPGLSEESRQFPARSAVRLGSNVSMYLMRNQHISDFRQETQQERQQVAGHCSPTARHLRAIVMVSVAILRLSSFATLPRPPPGGSKSFSKFAPEFAIKHEPAAAPCTWSAMWPWRRHIRSRLTRQGLGVAASRAARTTQRGAAPATAAKLCPSGRTRVGGGA
jgi:hypothetical protein